MYKKMKYIFLFIVIIIALFSQIIFMPAKQENVYVIQIDGEITPAMAAYTNKQIDIANEINADKIIIEIKTLGGRVDAAVDMRDSIIDSLVPVCIFIKERAISAGALISLAADEIAMTPGSHIGAAEPIPLNEKNLAYVKGEFKTTAQRQERDEDIAVAMVDKAVVIEGLTKEGEILDITADEAYERNFIDYYVSDFTELISTLGMEEAEIIQNELDFKYRIAQFLTRYEVASMLLTIGLIGIIAEFITQGFGFAGVIGIVSFVLYFAGGFLSGNVELWSVFLFLIGIVLLVIELTIPEFGVFGISGIIAIGASVIFTAPTIEQGFGTLSIAVVSTVIVIPILIKVLGRTKTMRKIVLSMAETTEEGYVHADSKNELLGKTGTAYTTLRPSGSAYIDGTKIDVIANGDFIAKDTEIKVIKVEGAKVIVSPNIKK